MKANYRRKYDMQLVSKVSIPFLIDIENIQKAICSMKIAGAKITSKSVTDWIKMELFSSGLTYFDYGFYDSGYVITEDIVQLSYELFPTFKPESL